MTRYKKSCFLCKKILIREEIRTNYEMGRDERMQCFECIKKDEKTIEFTIKNKKQIMDNNIKKDPVYNYLGENIRLNIHLYKIAIATLNPMDNIDLYKKSLIRLKDEIDLLHTHLCFDQNPTQEIHNEIISVATEVLEYQDKIESL